MAYEISITVNPAVGALPLPSRRRRRIFSLVVTPAKRIFAGCHFINFLRRVSRAFTSATSKKDYIRAGGKI